MLEIIRTKINTNKCHQNIKLVHIADIHFYQGYSKKRLNQIMEVIQKEKPNYLCITGDIIDHPKETSNIEIEDYQSFFQELTKYTEIILCLGNHDLLNGNEYYPLYQTFWSTLKQMDHIHILRNESFVVHDLCFSSYEAPKKYIENEKKYEQEIMSDFYSKSFSWKKEYYNILLVHSPITMVKYKKEMKNMDLILCGHTHNGLLPMFFSKNQQIHRGIISPTREWFLKNSRGIFLEKPILIVNGGIVKFSKTAHFLQKLDFLYPSSMNVIEINADH